MSLHVILTKGLQGSGKSTWADEFVKNNQKYKKVNRDSFRHMLSNYTFNPKNEKLVQTLWESAVTGVLQTGFNLVIDEMNLNPETLKKNINFVKKIVPDARIEVKEFNITLTDAIERDKRRPFSVGEKAVRNTFKKYIDPKPERDCYDIYTSKPKAICVDLDGTLALKSPDRNVYDGSKVDMDKVIEPVNTIIQMFHFYNETIRRQSNESETKWVSPYTIIFCSGRDSKFRDITDNWCTLHGIPYHHLFMRKEGDNRVDSIVKEEIYRTFIEPYYDVFLWIDDRIQVLEMVQNKLGLFTLDVRQDCRGLNDY